MCVENRSKLLSNNRITEVKSAVLYKIVFCSSRIRIKTNIGDEIVKIYCSVKFSTEQVLMRYRFRLM